MNAVRRSLGSLRVKLVLTVLLGTALFATSVALFFGYQLKAVYAESGKSELLAVARTFGAGFDAREVEDRRLMQARLTHLQELNPALVRGSVYMREGRADLRLASTDRGELTEPVLRHDVLPILTGRYVYEEEQEGGEHLAELNYPLRDATGRPAAALGLYYDLAPLDRALAKRERLVWLLGLAMTLLLAGFVTWSLRRSVFRPLDGFRRANTLIRHGEEGVRLGWTRSDELGELARDFDLMAAELEDSHARLHALALKDPLTGLLNHRAFQERLGVELSRAKREHRAVALMALDVDFFKTINDRFGHAAGDDALRLVAQTLVAAARASDVCGRIGGDEFMVVLPGADARGAEATAQRIRRAAAGCTSVARARDSR